jgi:hypothetical protein
MWQLPLAVTMMTAISGSASGQQLNNFTARVIVDKDLQGTVLGGQFTPATAINPSGQTATLNVAGANTATCITGTFTKTFWGAYVAAGNCTSTTSGAVKVGMLLQPLGNGLWVYSAGIEPFLASSSPVSVTVTLTISGQTGSGSATDQVLK